MNILLFFLGLLLPLAIVGGVETVYYVIDLIKYRKQIRQIRFNRKIKEEKGE